jgi:hypothetical protein
MDQGRTTTLKKVSSQNSREPLAFRVTRADISRGVPRESSLLSGRSNTADHFRITLSVFLDSKCDSLWNTMIIRCSN